MARYRGPINRLSRREGIDLFLTGAKRIKDDKLEERLEIPPGQHGQSGRRRKLSDYGIQLREKQKLKRIYGMLERQFRLFFARAARKGGVTGENLIELLERRLDNVVYRTFFGTTRREARQMVGHGHICVNGRPVNVASFIVKEGDVIEPKNKEAVRNRIKTKLEAAKDETVPDWVSVDRTNLKATIVRMPTKADAGLPVEEQLIVELYSK